MRRTLLCAATAVLGIAYVGLADDVPLEMRNAAIRFASQNDGPAVEGLVTLSGRFDPLAGPSHVEYQQDALAISLGGVEMLRIDPLDPRLKWRRKGTKVVFRQRARDGGARYLLVDLLRGRFRFRGARVDLAGLQEAGAWGVPVTLTVGDATIAGEVDFLASRNRRRARWKQVHGARAAERPLPLGDFGDSTNIRDRRFVVVRTDQEWQALWAEHSGGAAPSVDFASHMIVALFAGEKMSGGYGMELDAVEQDASGAVVKFTETSPGAHCVVTLAITYPFTIARVPRVDGEALFEGRDRVQNCRR